MTRAVLALSIVVAMFAVGCGSNSSGGIGLQPGINGCTNFPDMSGAITMRTVNFGGNLGNVYAPNCMGIAVGQTVTFSGSFNAHPLMPGLAPSQQGGPDAGSPNSPIQATSTGASANFVFANPGVYPYYCSLHQAQGMFGAIQVR
jgi:plastocyanin